MKQKQTFASIKISRYSNKAVINSKLTDLLEYLNYLLQLYNLGNNVMKKIARR